MIESVRRPADARTEPRQRRGVVPAAEPLHGRQHVLRLRLHRVRDARRARHGRAVHRHRDRARHARRPHRAPDQHDERLRPGVRLAGRRDLLRPGAGGARLRLGTVGARPRRLGGRIHLRQRPPRCGWRASTSRPPRSSTSGTSSACRRRPPPASSRRRSIAWPYPADRVSAGWRGRRGRARARRRSWSARSGSAVSRRSTSAGAVVPAAAAASRCSSRSSRPSRGSRCRVLAYGYLLSAFIELVVTRVRARREEPPPAASA